ncbi:MAG: pyridoxamine 5'-phosphate oxidase family protein [Candidatus Acidiferrales bacterium]
MPTRKQSQPRASRPSLPPEYGLFEPTKGEGLLPWSWAADHLARSRGQWLVTIRPNRSPHLMLVWGVWMDGRFYFCTSPRSRKARNLAANSRCAVATSRTDEVVVLEGVAEPVTDARKVARFKRAYTRHYRDDVDTSQFPVYAVLPHVVFGFISNPARWPGSATRWQFGRD